MHAAFCEESERGSAPDACSTERTTSKARQAPNGKAKIVSVLGGRKRAGVDPRVDAGAESLRQQQYYAFKHNAFWRIMGEVYGFSPELPYPERLAELRRHGVALWDVLAACERPGSLDSNIRDARPNDIPGLVAKLPKLERILCNGGASRSYLRRFFPELAARQLPSTSPAAARWSYAEKLAAWRTALET